MSKQQLILKSIFYLGSALKLPAEEENMYAVALRHLRFLYTNENLRFLFHLYAKGWYKKGKHYTHEEIEKFTEDFNTLARPFARAHSGTYNINFLGKEWAVEKCSRRVARRIMDLAYHCAVPDPRKLNKHYKGFSPSTYGETSLRQMGSMIRQLNIGKKDVFVDLGSGVGQLVCFTSAYAKCRKSVGIELEEKPAKYAEAMTLYFEKLMRHFGKKQHGTFDLYHGDFLDPRFEDLITKEATVIFINNYAFSAELMLDIKTKLLEKLKPGVRVISTKQIGNNKRITERTVDDISSISHTEQLETVKSAVSWTGNPVSFWLMTMDPSKLADYYAEQALVQAARESAQEKKNVEKKRKSSEESDEKENKKRRISDEQDEQKENKKTKTSDERVLKNHASRTVLAPLPQPIAEVNGSILHFLPPTSSFGESEMNLINSLGFFRSPDIQKAWSFWNQKN